MTDDGKKKYTESIDRALQAAIGKTTGGISPAAVMLAFFDWYFHLMMQPTKQYELLTHYLNSYTYFIHQLSGQVNSDQSGEVSLAASPQDKRFTGKSWQKFPYSYYYQSFLMLQNWWHVATSDVRGISQHHQDVVDFSIRQILDMISPSNSVFTNPEVLDTALAEKGENFVRGFKNLIDDVKRYQFGEPPAGAEQFVIGENIAVTKGKVIFRNRLIELIQYAPTTKSVYAEPILITPAWIMKYYILDLSPHHSLVKYLVDHGHTVFIISWKNPTKKDRDLGMNDYLHLGIFSALNTIKTVVPKAKIHLVGYCLGGTLTAIATATLAQNNDKRIASMTLLAAQTDFTEPGELGLFIDESQICFLENLMMEKGYLDTHQMAGAFQLLRSNDLIWSRMIHDYLLGSRKPLTDLMAWNADATRMPYKMHSEYLRQLFLHNQLAEGNYHVDNKAIALTDINVPIFIVATERDHVSPWRSVFKINLLTTGDITFTLTSGGHNVGIVSLPSSKNKRYYRMSTLKENDRYINADTWYHNTQPVDGSWWPAFESWIAAKSSQQKVDPPEMGCEEANIIPISEAPGTYVLEK